MLTLSQTTGYAILALSSLHPEGAVPVLIKDISDRTGISKPYLAKIFFRLGRKGLIHGKRGYKGGVTLSRPASTITVLDIIAAVEGDDWRNRCLLGASHCSDDSPCPLHEFWQKERLKIEQRLAALSLEKAMAFRKRGWRLRAD